MFFSTMFQEDVTQQSEYVLWGTPAPVVVKLGSETVSIVAKGSCSVNVKDQDAVQKIVESVANLSDRLRPMIVKYLTDVLVEVSGKVKKFNDIDHNIDKIAEEVGKRLQKEIESFGMEVVKFKIHTVGYQ